MDVSGNISAIPVWSRNILAYVEWSVSAVEQHKSAAPRGPNNGGAAMSAAYLPWQYAASCRGRYGATPLWLLYKIGGVPLLIFESESRQERDAVRALLEAKK